jgi:hypothetical protein
MCRKFFNDLSEHGHVCPEVGNGGNALALRKGDGDVEEQLISPMEMVSGPGDLFCPAYEPTRTRRKGGWRATHKDSNTMTIVSTTESA